MRRFLSYILREDGRSGIVTNGTVSYVGTKTPLPETFDGWQELLIKYERSLETHGLDTSVSLPLKFVRTAAFLLRDALYRETVESKLFVLIQRLFLEISDTKYKWVYKYLYKGELNLAQAEDEDLFVNVPISESSLERVVKAKEKTYYDFSMKDRRCVNIKMDGIIKNYNKKYSVQEGQEVKGTSDYYLGMFGSSSEGESPNIIFLDVLFKPASSYPNSDYFQEVVLSQQVRLRGFVDIYFNKSVSPVLRIETNDGGTGGFPQFSLISFGPAEPIGTQKRYNFDITFTVAATKRINMKVFGGSPSDASTQFTVIGGEINIIYDYRAPVSYIKAWKRFDMMKENVLRMTGNDSYAVSQLSIDYNYLVITSGDAIRGIDDSVVHSNYDEFFRDTDCTLMAGRAVYSDKVELESREKYYSETNIVNLGIVKDFLKKPASELMCNTYLFGHQKQDIEDVNGKYDPNGNNIFSGPLTKPEPKQYYMVSPWKASPYEIEDLRNKLKGKDTTDDNRDNHTFVIACKKLNPLSSSVSFNASLGGFIILDSERFFTHQQISITGTLLNNGIYDVESITNNPIGSGKLVKLIQSVIDESSVNAIFDFLLGEMVELDRTVWNTIEGVPNDSIFNIVFLTPKRMMFRHKRWIRSINAGLDNKKIIFNSGKDNENVLLKTIFNGGAEIIDEDADENVSDFGDYMFYPWWFIFKTEIPILLPEILENDPNTAFRIEDEDGNEWIGFNMMSGMAVNDYTPQEFRLLAAPSNNILKLIHV